MSKKNRSAEEILRAAFGIKNKVYEDIRKEENKTGEKITKEQKDKILKKIEGKYKIGMALAGGLLILSITTGANKALPSGDETPKIENTTENENNISARDAFTTEIKVSPNQVAIVDVNKETEQIREYVKNKVNSLETEEETLKYVKELYLDEYNSNYGTNYTTDQLEIKRYRDVEPEWVINATIDDNGKKISNAVYKGFYTGYQSCILDYRDIKDKEEDFMEDFAPVLDAGITHFASMNNDGTDKSLKDKRKEDFINKITEYAEKYKGKTYKKIMNDISQKSNEDNEIGG